MAKHIGIVAVSPEGSALCYRELFRYASKLMGDTGHPAVTVHNEPFERYIAAVRRDDWHAVGGLLSKSSKVLARAGAEFCIVADNLMQHGVELARAESPVPWLTMMEPVADAVAGDGRKVVGLIGTRMVMMGSTYQTHLGMRGVRVLVPEEEEAGEIDRIIFRELIYGVAREESERVLVGAIERLAGRGCEGVILGSSEAPLLVTEANSPLPVYDATALLAEGAVKCSIGERCLGGEGGDSAPPRRNGGRDPPTGPAHASLISGLLDREPGGGGGRMAGELFTLTGPSAAEGSPRADGNIEECPPAP